MKSGTCVKGDGYVNDEARARFWNDRETARLALDMAQQQAGVAKANEDIAKRLRNLTAKSTPRRPRPTTPKHKVPWKSTRPARMSLTRL
jgi:hypothetical protein